MPSQIVLAGEWANLNLNTQGFNVKLSYTKMYLPATYGFAGGLVHGKAFVDVSSPMSTVAESVEIYRIFKNGQHLRVQAIQLREETPRHFWGQLAAGPTYDSFLSVGTSYLLKLTVDGKTLEHKFTMI